MTDLTRYSVHNNIAVITLNDPPVNSLGHGLRQAIQAHYHKAIADSSIDAMVINSSGKLFCGGADISEFGTLKLFATPGLPELCLELEASSKPIIAAINGQALGGGLELALAADYRIANPDTKLGLPEVMLGLLPGAGGTQRLPRLTSPKFAVEMICSGKPVNGTTALKNKLIDKLNETDDLQEAAIQYAKQLVADKAPTKNCADIEIGLLKHPPGFFALARKGVAPKAKGYFAPWRALEAIEHACNLPLKEGLQKEQDLFLQCMSTPQHRSLRHVFMSEREARKIPGINSETETRVIRKVAIIGSGTMGGGIAMNFANIGLDVLILDLNAEALQKGLNRVRKNYEVSAKKGRLSDDDVEQRMSLFKGTTSYADLADVDLVIEAVFERMDIKQTVFKELDQVCKPGAILATNTSTLNVNKIAAVTNRPQDVVGLHFFSPANVMKLLEIVRGAETSASTLASCLKMATQIRKTPVVVGVCSGFVGNRMLNPYSREAHRLVLEGATPEQVDNALTEFGLAMGPFAMFDLAGIDVGYMIRQSHQDQSSNHTSKNDSSYLLISEKLYHLDRFGQKTGRGFYIYKGREKKADPEVVTLCEELADELNITRRTISDQEIIERCIYELINEAAKILDEGIAYRSGDCDIVWVYGYGFPPFRGGPMQYADEIGLDKVVASINKYRKNLGDYGQMWFSPAPLLEKLALASKPFTSFKDNITED